MVLSLVFFASDLRVGLLAMLILNAILAVILDGIAVPYNLVVYVIGFIVCLLALSFYFKPNQMGVTA
jgi:hypothetical protein